MLIAVLIAADQTVTYVSGRVVNRMTGAFRGEGKTDARYALVIAETARLRRDLTTITEPDGVVAELGLLTGYRADLMGTGSPALAVFEHSCCGSFPNSNGPLTTPPAPAWPSSPNYCTPVAIRAASMDEISVHLREMGADEDPTKWTSLTYMFDELIAAIASGSEFDGWTADVIDGELTWDLEGRP